MPKQPQLMEMFKPLLKTIDGQEKLCCGSPNCKNILAVLKRESDHNVLFLPKGHIYLHTLIEYPLYGPESWINGPKRLIPVPGQKEPKLVNFYRHFGDKPKESIWTTSQYGVPRNLIACASGHAIHPAEGYVVCS